MTLQGLLDTRAAAGSQYQAAVDRLYAAYIQLAALDATLLNANINPNCSDVRTFSPLAADEALRSPEILPANTSMRLAGNYCKMA